IGIEHEGFIDNAAWYTEAMYQSSAALSCAIAKRYGIPVDRSHFLGHVDVPNQSHTDPGPNWNWGHYLDLVRACNGGGGQAGLSSSHAMLSSPRQQHYFDRGTDGHLRHWWWDPRSGNQQEDWGAGLDGAPVAYVTQNDSGQEQGVFGRGTDGHLHHWYWNPS